MKLRTLVCAIGVSAAALLGSGGAAIAAPAPAPSAAAQGLTDSQAMAAAAYGSCNSQYYTATIDGSGAYLPSIGYDVNCVLGQGNSGTAVRALQSTLRQCYGQSITVDGQFGSGTKTALRNAQSRAGVSADGVYGPNTREAFSWPSRYGCSRLDRTP